MFFLQTASADRRELGANPDIAMISVVIFNQAPHTFDEAVTDFNDLISNSNTTRTILAEEPLVLSSGRLAIQAHRIRT